MNKRKDAGYINIWHSYYVAGDLCCTGKIFDSFTEADEAVGKDRYGFYGTFKVERVESDCDEAL